MHKFFSEEKVEPLPNEGTSFYKKICDSKPATIKEWGDNLFSALETAIKNKDLKQLKKLLGLSSIKLVDKENEEKSKKTIRFLNYIRNLKETQALLWLAIKENQESIFLLMQQEEFKQALMSNHSEAFPLILYIFSHNSLEKVKENIINELSLEPKMLESLIFDNDDLNDVRNIIFHKMKPRILACVASLIKKQNSSNLEEPFSEKELLFCKAAKGLFEQHLETEVMYLLKRYINYLNLKKLKENITKYIEKKPNAIFKLTDEELDLCIKLSLEFPKNSPIHRYVILILATCAPPNEFVEVRHTLSQGQELGHLNEEDNYTVTIRTSATL